MQGVLEQIGYRRLPQQAFDRLCGGWGLGFHANIRIWIKSSDKLDLWATSVSRCGFGGDIV